MLLQCHYKECGTKPQGLCQEKEKGGNHMKFWKEENALVFKHQYETVKITPWGKNALRVQATKYPGFTDKNWALEEEVPFYGECSIEIEEGEKASITNGRLTISADKAGILTFYRDGEKFLKEYHRDYDQPSCAESRCLKIRGRQWKSIIGGDYSLAVRFESNDREKYTEWGSISRRIWI